MRISNDKRHSQLNSTKNQGAVQSSSSSRSEESMLGNTTGFASTESYQRIEQSLPTKIENNENRYALQKIAKKYHPNTRLSACMCTVAPHANNIELHYDDKTRHAHYRNIMRCDNVWICPVCSGRITSRRAQEIRQAYSYAVDTLKLRVVMVTYTMSHRNFHSLQANLDDLRDSRRKMRSGRKWQKFKADYGYVGAISSLEVTASLKNGWHVHVHEIMFLDDSKADYDLSAKDSVLDAWLDDTLSQWWIDSLEKNGRTASLKNGIEVSSADKYVAEYVAKFGKLPEKTTWDVALEIAKSASKRDSEGIHPFTILERSDCPAVDENDRKRYRAMWHEYADAFTGRKQIYWTVGLKELLLVDVIEDEADIEEEGKFAYGISRDAWQAIVYTGRQADVLNECIMVRGDLKRIEHYLKKLIVDANRMRKVSEYRSET